MFLKICRLKKLMYISTRETLALEEEQLSANALLVLIWYLLGQKRLRLFQSLCYYIKQPSEVLASLTLLPFSWDVSMQSVFSDSSSGTHPFRRHCSSFPGWAQLLPRCWKLSFKVLATFGSSCPFAFAFLCLAGENEKRNIRVPNRQTGFQRTKVIFKASLPSVYADKRLSLQELYGTTYTVGPLQISTKDNIIITLLNKGRKKLHLKYPLSGCSRGACVSSVLVSRCRG